MRNLFRTDAAAKPDLACASGGGYGISCTALVLPCSSSHWISEINRVWSQGTTATIDLAKVVWTAKKQLHCGQWTAMWRSESVPFSKRKGEMLVAVARSLGDLNAQTSAQLPYGWNTLYQLAQLPRCVLEQCLQDGTIGPGLTLQQAKDLVARLTGRIPHEGRGRSKLKARLERFTDFVRENFKDWSAEERDSVRTELRDLLDELAFPPWEAGLGKTEIPTQVSGL